jgi:hypothetical protein
MGSSVSTNNPALSNPAPTGQDHILFIKTLVTNICSHNTARHDRRQGLLSLARLAQTQVSLCSDIGLEMGAAGVRAVLKDLTHNDSLIRCAAAKLLIVLAPGDSSVRLVFSNLFHVSVCIDYAFCPDLFA